MNETILLIEDNHDIRVTIRQALEDSGHCLFSVANGRDALTLLDKIVQPKLILLDLRMPIMNGIEFLRHKEADPKLADIPVIIVSGFLDKIEGLDKYPAISKPIDITALRAEVTRILNLTPVLPHKTVSPAISSL
ncbi:MAG: response regulator [Bdellovibrionales bacterium]|nr:response regulator [Bdellovibrionales bacterium]